MSDQPPGGPIPPGGWVELPDATPTEVPPLGAPTGVVLPPPPPPPSNDAPDGRRRRRWPYVVAALVVLAGVAGAVVVFVGGDAGPDHPDEWDARVLPLVEFVEDERDLVFEHPVTVEFLDEDAWREQAEIDEDEILDEDAELLEHGAGMFRAIGLAEGELDLLSDMEELGATGTVGHYDFEDGKIRIRGTELSPKIEAVLVHELVHVLQDQHFDIGTRVKAVAEEDTDEESLRVLVEGDADRIEDIWIDELPEDERTALEDARSEESAEAFEDLEELPQSLVTFFSSPYILGAGFMDILEADGESIDDAFADPPGPEEHVADPISYLEDDRENDVEAPSVDGEPIEDLEGAFGAVSLYLMLAERTDPVAALAAVDGWGGDAFVGYRDGDRTCVALRLVGEDVAASEAMATALTTWAEAMPAEAEATVDIDGDTVDVITCDPGEEADLTEESGRSQDTISLFAIRSDLAASVIDGGGTNDQARCFSRGMIADLDYELLISDEATPEQQAQIQRVATAQVLACR